MFFRRKSSGLILSDRANLRIKSAFPNSFVNHTKVHQKTKRRNERQKIGVHNTIPPIAPETAMNANHHLPSTATMNIEKMMRKVAIPPTHTDGSVHKVLKISSMVLLPSVGCWFSSALFSPMWGGEFGNPLLLCTIRVHSVKLSYCLILNDIIFGRRGRGAYPFTHRSVRSVSLKPQPLRSPVHEEAGIVYGFLTM